jgi:hypothetical protein
MSRSQSYFLLHFWTILPNPQLYSLVPSSVILTLILTLHLHLQLLLLVILVPPSA